MTFAAWVDRYLDVADHKAATTRSRDETVLRTHLVPRLGELRLVEITPLDVQAVVNEMAQHLAPATVRTNYGVLRAVLERSRRGRTTRRAAPVDASSSRGDQQHATARSNPGNSTASRPAMPTEYRLLVYIGGVLGLRWSELAGLRVGRMNVLGRTLEVAEAIKYVSGRLVDDGEVKSKAARRVLGMPEQLAAHAAAHLAQRGLSAADERSLVFTAPEGGPLHYQNFMQRIWRPAALVAGLEGVTAHDLRHTAATYLDAVGAPEQLIRRRLGHGSSDITRRVYVHVLEESDKTVTARPRRPRLEASTYVASCTHARQFVIVTTSASQMR